ncbi:hypothetical protein [Stenotrophomonas sp.]|uniref:hypothetical protein n=1 Tax=Stenotrophomonas sp. TaxID=69392 RepID=UPI0028AA9F24|nr:hypothetical protein [Stenotrophomonas sp.]
MQKPAATSRLRRWRLPAFAAVALAAYPCFVLGTVYWNFFQAGLPGGRNGPADAYRHSLASAIVGYTLSPRCVDWVSKVMENDGQGNASRAMDAHNNRIGARIGAAAPSWAAMLRDVRAAVEHGAVDAASTDQITWLAPSAWQDRLY